MELTKSDDILIFNYYLGGVTINDKIRSPLRPDDDTPSFLLTVYNDRIKWKDFGLEHDGSSAIDFVMFVEGLSYPEAMDYYKGTIMRSQSGSVPVMTIREKDPVNPVIKYSHDFTDEELSYWLDRGISGDQLIREEVYRLDSLIWGEGGKTTKSIPGDPKFVYRYSKDSWKIYAPLTRNKKYKWQSFNLKGVIERWKSLPKKGDVLIIASSLKDGLVVENATGVPTISPTGEHAWKYIMAKKGKISKRFKRVVALYDADEAGYTASKKLSLLCGFEYRDLRSTLTVKGKEYKDFDEMKKDGVSDKKIRKIIKKLLK